MSGQETKPPACSCADSGSLSLWLSHYQHLQDSALKYHNYRIAFTAASVLIVSALLAFVSQDHGENKFIEIFLGIFVVLVGLCGLFIVQGTNKNVIHIEFRSLKTLEQIQERFPKCAIPGIEREIFEDYEQKVAEGNRPDLGTRPAKSIFYLRTIYYFMFGLLIVLGLGIIAFSVFQPELPSSPTEQSTVTTIEPEQPVQDVPEAPNLE